VKAEHITIEVQPDLRLAGDIFGGEGPPVIFLHGGGQTRHSWRKTAEALARDGFAAIAFDQRGHGDSDRAPDRRYGFEAFAADSAALARAMAKRFGRKPAVVGASLGGLSSLIATGQGDDNPFSALVLVDVTPRMDPRGVEAVQGFMRDKAAEGFATVQEAADAISAYLPHRPKPKSLDGLRKNLRRAENGRYYWHWDPDFVNGPHPIENHRDRIEDLALKATANLTIPSLLVRGASSELVREDQAAEFLALARGSEFVDVAEARHMVAGDSNSVFTEAVTAFLKRKLINAL
jgi:pimeloyl-ACP methyl ester carboxylesterase